jgi:hypothetical protein
MLVRVMLMRPCLDCGRPSRGSRCPVHESLRQSARDARRGSREERGLGYHYRKERDALVAEAGLTHCPRCERPITKTNPITAEHGTPRAHGGTEITGLLCRSCNSSLGATVRGPQT